MICLQFTCIMFIFTAMLTTSFYYYYFFFIAIACLQIYARNSSSGSHLFGVSISHARRDLVFHFDSIMSGACLVSYFGQPIRQCLYSLNSTNRVSLALPWSHNFSLYNRMIFELISLDRRKISHGKFHHEF